MNQNPITNSFTSPVPNTPNPMFAKFDQVLGVQTPTTSEPKVTSRADEIRALAKPPPPGAAGVMVNSASDITNKVVNNAKDFGKNVSTDFQSARTDMGNVFEDALSGKQGGGTIGNLILNSLGVGSKLGLNIIGDAIKPLMGDAWDALGKPMQDSIHQGVSSILNSKLGQEGVAAAKIGSENYNIWKQKNPDFAKNLESVVNIGGFIASAGGIIDTTKYGIKIASDSTSLFEQTPEQISAASNARAAAAAAKTAENATKNAESFVKDATPSYSKKMIGESGIKNPDGTITPRVQEGGIASGRKITPTSLEEQAGQQLSKVPDYPTNGTALEKYQAVQPELSARGKLLQQSLENEHILRPPQQITKVVSDAVNDVPKESLLLQKSDPVIKNYMRVVKNAVTQNDGTLAGELKIRQAMDDAYENARGKLAYGSDKISALDDVHSAARDALNKDIIEHAIETDVKTHLKEQWDLYRAADVLRAKAEAESGTAIGRFIQRNPVTSKVLKAAGNAVGIGGAVNLIP